MVARRAISTTLAAVAILAGCDAAEDVQVQPLPSLDASSPEARLGLPEIAGAWRFAGWELAPGDTGRVPEELPALGTVQIQTQRLDSVAGFYAAGAGRVPLVGEVRRDGVLALAGGGRFMAGRVARDTFWLALTSLLESESWPRDARAAFVRAPSGSRFVRVKGEIPPLAAADTALPDTTSVPVPPVQPPVGAPLAGQGERARGAAPAPASGAPPSGERAPVERAPTRAEPPPAQPPAQQEAQVEEPVDPEPEPEPEAPRPSRRRQPRLLGVPVDSSSHSPTVDRAISRPVAVSTSR